MVDSAGVEGKEKTVLAETWVPKALASLGEALPGAKGAKRAFKYKSIAVWKESPAMGEPP